MSGQINQDQLAIQLTCESTVLNEFVRHLGFDPKKLVKELSHEADNQACKWMAIDALKVVRDFHDTSFSDKGIEASNIWLDSLRLSKEGLNNDDGTSECQCE